MAPLTGDPTVSIAGETLPIIQAPMAGVQGSQLTIAVSDAGGLGSLPCGMLTPDQVVQELERIVATTSRPYNLNFFCHQMPPDDAAAAEAWTTTLAPYFAEFGVTDIPIPSGASRLPFSHEMADAIAHFEPPVVSFHFGLPEASLLERVKAWGATVLSSATTLDEARWLQAQGADVIIAQGLEAGGHRGMFLSTDVTTQLGLTALLPQVLAAVDVPVIAAGGIASRAGVEVALQLGASAVQVGTAYLLCPELTTSPLHRAALSSMRAEHTALTNVFSGRPARGIVNRVMQDLGYLCATAPAFPHASALMTELRKLAEQQGEDSFSPLWCGQNPSGCEAISAAELTRKLAGL